MNSKLKLAALAAVMALLGLMMAAASGKDLLEFAERTYDFGTVSETAEPVVHEYEFVNLADEPVAVLSVSTGCGCTRPIYPTEPIAPGAKNSIKITFTPAGQAGSVNKEIKVRYRGATASSSRRVTLRLRGKVTPAH